MSPKTSVDSFLFRPAPADYLGVCRLLFFGWLFCWYLSESFSILGHYPVDLWSPLLLLKILHLDFLPSPWVILIVASIWKASLFLACIGLFTRLSIGIALFLGTYLLALTHSFEKINHSDAGLLFAMGLLFLARSGDAFSIDRLIRVGQGVEQKPPPADGEYRWPVESIRLLLVLVFFLAGLAKLMLGGLAWMNGDSFGATLVRAQMTRDVPVEIGMLLASMGWMMTGLAVGTVAVELAAPAALFFRRLRLFIIPALLGMQIGIRLIMGDNFTQFMALYVFWVPWLGLAAVLPVLGLAPNRRQVLYDSRIPLCRVGKRVLAELDLFGRIRWQDTSGFQSAGAGSKFVVINPRGEVARGGAAASQLAWTLPLVWPVLPILALPGLSNALLRLGKLFLKRHWPQSISAS